LNVVRRLIFLNNGSRDRFRRYRIHIHVDIAASKGREVDEKVKRISGTESNTRTAAGASERTVARSGTVKGWTCNTRVAEPV